MTSINDLITRIFLANIKKYRLFLICNTCAISIMFSMISLINNRSLMYSDSVDSMISSNIYAPTALVVIFVAIFVPYTYSLLKKDTYRDYGILNSIGMSSNEINRCMFLETLILGGISILGGVLLGNILGILVYLVVHFLVGIEGLQYENSINTYKFVVLYIGALYVIAYLIDTINRRLSNIVDVILNKRKSESGKGSVVIFVIGVAMILFSFVMLLVLYGFNSNISAICILLSVAGIILVVGNGQFIFRKIKRNDKCIFVLNDFLYYYKRNARIILVTFGMLFVVLFFSVFTLVTYPNFSNNAKIYNPYHITYSEFSSVESTLSEEELKEVAMEFGTNIVSYDKIVFLYINNMPVFSLDDINDCLSRDYQLVDGQCIHVQCEYLDDGYEHELNDISPTVSLGDVIFEVKESVFDVLFGKSILTQWGVLIVTNHDFDQLVGKQMFRQNNLNLINFEDYRKTIGLEQSIREEIVKRNEGMNLNEITVTSRALASKNARESSNFLLFLVLYISILFYNSVLIMIYYKFAMEAEEDINRVRLLQSIGATKEELRRILRGKVRLICFISFAFPSVSTILYGYGTNYTYGYGGVGIKYAIEVFLVWLFILVITIEVYYRRYMRMVLVC